MTTELDDNFGMIVVPNVQPFTEEELNKAQLGQKCIVTDTMYATLAMTAAPGGMGKTTFKIYEAVHVAIGMDFLGYPVLHSGATLFITSEDWRDLYAARLREIIRALNLTPNERKLALSKIRVWDVSGTGYRLAKADSGGNIVLTEMADRIIDAFAHSNLVHIVFDPAIGFGPGERFVNDGQQGIVDACRRIIKGLGCCVEVVDHTGKSNARSGATDMYANRGGTALPDGCRVINVLTAATDELLKHAPEGFELSPGDSGFILARPKLSYTKPQPNIWIRRRDFAYEYFIAETRSKSAQQSLDMEHIEEFIRSELLEGRKHSKTSMETALLNNTKLTRDRVRSAISMLEVSGRIGYEELPKEEISMGRKWYLKPLFSMTEVPPNTSAEPSAN